MDTGNANTTPTSGITRTKSEQLETVARKSASVDVEVGSSLTRKPSYGKRLGASPGRSSKRHIRKSRSGQLKLDLDEVSSGAALSRASSASLGLSFSFTGFTLPPEEIADLGGFSDEENGQYTVTLFDISLAIGSDINGPIRPAPITCGQGSTFLSFGTVLNLLVKLA